MDNGIKYQIRFWDTAGQERFREIRKTYMRKQDCYVFVFDHSEEDTLQSIESKYIKQMMEFASEDSLKKPLFLIGNKSDINDEDKKVKQADIFNLIKNYGMKYFDVSCKLNQNVDQLFEEIKLKTIEYTKSDSYINNQNIQLTSKVDEKKKQRRNCC
eukprot:403338130